MIVYGRSGLTNGQSLNLVNDRQKQLRQFVNETRRRSTSFVSAVSDSFTHHLCMLAAGCHPLKVCGPCPLHSLLLSVYCWRKAIQAIRVVHYIPLESSTRTLQPTTHRDGSARTTTSKPLSSRNHGTACASSRCKSRSTASKAHFSVS